MNEGPLLELRSVTKSFGAVRAVDDVSLEVMPGEIRGLLGQNGAGKSTLMRIVCGVERPDRGCVAVAGTPIPPGDAAASLAAGIGMVHQHFSLVGPMTVWENVTLGESGPVSGRRLARRVAEIGERYGLEVDPHARVEDLSPGQRQRVEIIKCLRLDPRVIVLDEPTSVLTREESATLFGVLRSLVTHEGRALVLISHRLEEILEATQRATVLRDGRVVADLVTAHATAAALATEMVGRPVSLRREAAALGLGAEGTAGQPRPAQSREREAPTEGRTRPNGDAPAALRLVDVSARAPDGRVLLDHCNLELWPGEVLGVAGVEGNGQSALVHVLSNLLTPDSGTLAVDGVTRRVGRRGALADVAVVPADRHDSGCILAMSVAENLLLDQLDLVSRRGVIDRRSLWARSEALMADFDITAPGPDAPMWALSGGNQQRVVLARELSKRPSVLVVSQPTQGLDVGAMEDMWDRLRRAADGGTAVLLVSTELDEILALADRLVVMQRGRFTGQMSRGDVDIQRLGLLMGGHAA